MAGLMPEGWNCGDECLLNGLYTWAEDHRDQFPAGTESPGVLATREAVEALSGLDIQYYVLVDLKGFRKMVDAVGRPRHRGPAAHPDRRRHVEHQGLDRAGHPAPRRLPRPLVRPQPRHGSTNYERMARQRCVMTAMVDQLDPQTVLTRFQKIAGGQLRASSAPTSRSPSSATSPTWR